MSSTQALNASSYNEVELWHRRLGHLHGSKMRVLVPSLSESGVSELQSYVCKRASHILLEYSYSESHCSVLFELVHSDVRGPAPTLSLSGYNDFVTFLDSFSRLTTVYQQISLDEVRFILPLR